MVLVSFNVEQSRTFQIIVGVGVGQQNVIPGGGHHYGLEVTLTDLIDRQHEG